MIVMPLIHVVLLLLCIAISLKILALKDMLKAAVLLGVMNLIVALYFYAVNAPDLAVTQASVNAAVATAIFVYAIRRSGERYE